MVFHRCGGKSLGYPPNTLLALKWAVEYGAKAVEYDVVLCKDDEEGSIVVIEPKIIKQAGLDVNNLVCSEVSKLAAGNRKYGHCEAPKLEDMLQAANPSKIAHQIHIKGNHSDIIKVLLPKLQRYTNYILTTFDITTLRQIKEVAPTVRVGWIVKPHRETGYEGLEDLTASVTANVDSFLPYSESELDEIIEMAKAESVDIIILCGPRIQQKGTVDIVKKAGFELGAWGVGTNLEVARRLIEYQVDRFTIDNPEELTLQRLRKVKVES